LGRDRIEKLTPGRETHLGDVEEDSPRESQAFVDLERAVHVWVIDETFPPDRRAGFLEIYAHDNVQVIFGLQRVVTQFLCVFKGGFDVVN
jgi:hypothetical protein